MARYLFVFFLNLQCACVNFLLSIFFISSTKPPLLCAHAPAPTHLYHLLTGALLGRSASLTRDSCGITNLNSNDRRAKAVGERDAALECVSLARHGSSSCSVSSGSARPTELLCCPLERIEQRNQHRLRVDPRYPLSVQPLGGRNLAYAVAQGRAHMCAPSRAHPRWLATRGGEIVAGCAACANAARSRARACAPSPPPSRVRPPSAHTWPTSATALTRSSESPSSQLSTNRPSPRASAMVAGYHRPLRYSPHTRSPTW